MVIPLSRQAADRGQRVQKCLGDQVPAWLRQDPRAASYLCTRSWQVRSSALEAFQAFGPMVGREASRLLMVCGVV